MRRVFEFEANLAEVPEAGLASPLVDQVPLRGAWFFKIGHIAEPPSLGFEVRHAGLPSAVFDQAISVTVSLGLLVDGKLHEVKSVTWPPGRLIDDSVDESAPYPGHHLPLSMEQLATKIGKFVPFASPQRYTLKAIFKSSLVGTVAGQATSPFDDLTKALRVALADPAGSTESKSVRLVFPRAGSESLELWTTDAFLKQISPYYKAMLDSGCVETVPRRSKRARLDEPRPAADPAKDKLETASLWDDSDDETDAFVSKNGIATTKTDEAELEYSQITVREAAYATYCAVFLYLKSGHIAFAPLRSSLVTTGDAQAVTASHEQYLRVYRNANPSLPLPVSPKSVYRLAHLLQLSDLQKLALEALGSSLTVSCAIHEIFSPTAMAYDEVRKLLRDFVLKHLTTLSSNAAWKAQQEKANRGELEGPALVMMEFLTAIFEAKKQG